VGDQCSYFCIASGFLCCPGQIPQLDGASVPHRNKREVRAFLRPAAAYMLGWDKPLISRCWVSGKSGRYLGRQAKL